MHTLSQRKIFLFWLPLAATWLMMSAEGPFLAAIIARLGDPKYNLAAFGVAFAFAMLIESPIIMMLSASTALVRDCQSFYALRRFVFSLNALITVAIMLLVVPPVFFFITERLIGLPHEVARLAHIATAVLIPWPAAIGYRRFFHGLLIRHNLTRRVAYGTVIRITTMAVTGMSLFLFAALPGVVVAAIALSVGVIMEALVARFMAQGIVDQIRRDTQPSVGIARLTLGGITTFYYPLALTSMLTLGVNPLVTFFLGRSTAAVDSLAVLPVVTSLVFLFRSGGIGLQETCIALLGDRGEGYEPLKRFAKLLALGLTAALTIMAFTPLSVVWFARVSGLPPDLVAFAQLPLRILFLMPAFEVLLSFQRSLLVHARRTKWITLGTAIEVTGIVVVLAIGVGGLHQVGVVVAASGIVIGRICANTFLIRPSRTVQYTLPTPG